MIHRIGIHVGLHLLRQWRDSRVQITNQFIDFGILGKAATKVSGNPVNIGIGMAGGTAGGIEAGYTLGMHAGFKSYVKGTGALSGFVKAGF